MNLNSHIYIKNTIKIKSKAWIKNGLTIGLFFFTIYSFAQSPRRSYKSGLESFKKQYYSKAIEHFTKAIESKNSKYNDAFVYRAKSYEALNKKIEAVDDYINAAQLLPKNVEVSQKASRMLYNMYNYKAALIYANRTIAIDSQNFEALKIKSLCLIHNNKFEKALLLTEKAAEFGEDAELFYAKALASDSLKLTFYAIAYYKKSTEMDKHFSPTYKAYTRLLIKTEFYHKALEVISKSANLFNDPESYEIRASIYNIINEPRKQINDITKTITLDPSRTELLFKRSLLYEKINLLNNALFDINQYLKKVPDNKDAILFKARMHERVYEKEKAIDAYKKYLDLETYTEAKKQAENAVFRLQTEAVPPTITITSPPQPDDESISIGQSDKKFTIKGKVYDQSEVIAVLVNDEDTEFGLMGNNRYVFSVTLDVDSTNTVKIQAMDAYGNISTKTLRIVKNEQKPPIVLLSEPTLESDSSISVSDSRLIISGNIIESSALKSFKINDKEISYSRKDQSFYFTEELETSGIDSLKIEAIDYFANESSYQFKINRTDSLASDLLPQGKTWIAIVSSDSIMGKKLEPVKKLRDSLIEALAYFKIDSIILYNSITKEDLERKLFFELPSLTKKNRVKSLVIYYMGPGISFNGFTYWIVNKTNSSYTTVNTSMIRTIFESLSHIENKTIVSESVLIGLNSILPSDLYEMNTCDNPNDIPKRSEFAMGIKVENWHNYSSPVLRDLRNAIDKNQKCFSIFDLIGDKSITKNYGSILDADLPVYPVVIISKNY